MLIVQHLRQSPVKFDQHSDDVKSREYLQTPQFIFYMPEKLRKQVYTYIEKLFKRH